MTEIEASPPLWESGPRSDSRRHALSGGEVIVATREDAAKQIQHLRSWTSSEIPGIDAEALEQMMSASCRNDSVRVSHDKRATLHIVHEIKGNASQNLSARIALK